MNSLLKTRFEGGMRAARIIAATTVKPDPISSLTNIHAHVGAQVLGDSLKQIFIPNTFAVDLIMEMMGRAHLHSSKVFASQKAYVSEVYCPSEREIFPICLTGLAGVGKSETITALRKVLPKPLDFTCDHFKGVVTAKSHWYASARENSGEKVLLNHLLYEDQSPRGRVTTAELRNAYRRVANRDGISLGILDELQHMSNGEGVARATEMLLNMAKVAIPLLYVSNYSLMHKLFKGSSECKQRLLSQPRIMLPDDPGSSDWRNYIDECVRVSNGHISTGSVNLADEIYRRTFGLKRLVVELLQISYVECRKAGRDSVLVSDLQRAFCSSEYTSNAKDVEELILQSQNPLRRPAARLDLYCPFDLPAEARSNMSDFARRERAERVNAKIFDSSLSQAERSSLEYFQATVQEKTKPVRKTKRSPVKKLTEEEQEKAFYAYASTLPCVTIPRRSG